MRSIGVLDGPLGADDVGETLGRRLAAEQGSSWRRRSPNRRLGAAPRPLAWCALSPPLARSPPRSRAACASRPRSTCAPSRPAAPPVPASPGSRSACPPSSFTCASVSFASVANTCSRCVGDRSEAVSNDRRSALPSTATTSPSSPARSCAGAAAPSAARRIQIPEQPRERVVARNAVRKRQEPPQPLLPLPPEVLHVDAGASASERVSSATTSISCRSWRLALSRLGSSTS